MPPAHAIQTPAPDLDEPSLRAAFGRFATGVAFVTTEVGGTPLGLIVSSFAAVSLEPPLVSFCPSRASSPWQRVRHGERFCVHGVDEAHGSCARRATPPGADRFADPHVVPDAVAS